MQLSIIIVNYNVEHYLALCLDSVKAAIANLDAEVIVVDNASIDGSVQMTHEKFPEVSVIANQDNRGFSAANNQGVALAKGEYVCILNPDTVVAEDTFEKVYAFYKQRESEVYAERSRSTKAQEKPGVIGVRLIDGTGAYLPESKRNLPTPKVSLNKMIGDGSAYYANHLLPDQNGKVSVLVGAFMFMKKSIYEEVGGFDERYFMYGEDIDLSYTIEQAGYINYYLGEEAIIHFKGESTIKDDTYRERFFGAMRLFYEKHFSRNVIEKSIVRLGLQGAKFKASLQSSSIETKGVMKSTEMSEYLLVTDNDVLLQCFEEATKTVVSNTTNKQVGEKHDNEVYDAAYLTYQEIINLMITRCEEHRTFKIIPKNSTFALGSNSKEGRGEVIQW